MGRLRGLARLTARSTASAANKDVSKHKRNAKNEPETLLQNLIKVPDDDLHHPNTDKATSHQKLSLGWLRDNISGIHIGPKLP